MRDLLLVYFHEKIQQKKTKADERAIFQALAELFAGRCAPESGSPTPNRMQWLFNPS